jgi:murein DD-endopeptidase MepM/ murein hydrolase activator NlpD
MLSKRYTVLIADRTTGVTRRLTISVRGALVTALAGACLWTVPVLVGLGARWSASVEIGALQAANHALQLENDSFRAVTGELTTQIASLQSMVAEIGERGATDAAQQKAMANLPALVRNRAMGGAAPATATRSLLSAMVSPEDTFGVLRDLLGALESRLRLVRTDVDRWQALADATPSFWPAIGWLTGGFGQRSDPFTGEPAQHLGLDISADKGNPVYASAHGTVQTAARHAEFGNLVELTHEFGLMTRYAHLSRIAVKPGARVQRGEVIGYVGSTGRSTAPHLHYEVWANGRPLNPLRLLTAKPAQP